MPAIHADQTPRQSIGPDRERYVAANEQLMMVVIDLNDGPGDAPDPPHEHPHEQISYVAAGELLFIIGEEEHHVREGDMVTIPPGVPHTIQLISASARLVDAFHPIREDFL